MHENERLNDHQKFKELAALAQGRGLTVSERIELKRDLQLGEACRAIYREYSLLSSEGMAFLAADCGHVSEADAWDYRAAQNELSSRIRESEHSAIASAEVDRRRPARAGPAWVAALRAVENHSSELSTANSKGETQYRQVSEERDKLASQVRDAEKAYQLLQLEFTSLHAEHDRVLLRTASLESKIDELSAAARDQDRRLKDNEQYLASDRDIRELMGARKLYIADVFDVDSGSRTRKPFGRVFYTQNKSLIFYAFDLDRQPGVKNASAFQVWGQRDGELSAKSHPMNLGILYMDSDSNRRWVLRWDDPKQLAEIDAVFVTVEPHGGSQKPTGKPFLYALLRKEANHP